MTTPTHTYNPGHPWYYVLGGKILRPKEILNDVKKSGYKGYLEKDIQAIDRRDEPKRSEKLREVRSKEVIAIKRDISLYRSIAYQVRQYYQEVILSNKEPEYKGFHTCISLKHNHIYNRLAHLVYVDDLLSVQPDLFNL